MVQISNGNHATGEFLSLIHILKDRHNAVEVNWIDPNNGWETATELVEDTQAIARYGRNVTKMDAFEMCIRDRYGSH